MGDTRLKGWYRRGDQHPPHFDAGEIAQFVTFRLADSLPAERLQVWKAELDSGTLKPDAYCERIESWLDAGRGECWLADPQVGTIVQGALLHFDGRRYDLHGWVIMPNHIHVLVTPRDSFSLPALLHSWKSFTASTANKSLGRRGAFWQDDYFDRYVRSETDFARDMDYIAENPVRAGLCRTSADWKWSHAFRGPTRF
ncbi:MAG: transposase [Planctomycetes bacterium]|nr:transposase [Planctomycetota bacterium]